MDDEYEDHGELDWHGAPTNLAGRTIVVIGAAGGVGADITRELLTSGADVVATGRNQARLVEFVRTLEAEAFPGSVTGFALDALDGQLDETVATLVEGHGPFDGVVIAVGDWGKPGQGKKPLVQHTDEEWRDLVEGNLTSVFRLVRAFVPVLPAGSAIVQVNGLSADVPYPTNGAVGATSAGTKSLMRTTAVELDGAGPRIYELILGVVRTRTNPDNTLPGYSWLTGAQAGQHIAALVAGTSDLDHEVVQYFVDHHQGPVAGSAML